MDVSKMEISSEPPDPPDPFSQNKKIKILESEA